MKPGDLVRAIFYPLTAPSVVMSLIDDVSIPDALEPDEHEIAADIEKARTEVLSHAYGFVSRGNRSGGFAHVIGNIDKDPDPVAAWAWYFNRMLLWESTEHALFFAQRYIHDLLQQGRDRGRKLQR